LKKEKGCTLFGRFDNGETFEIMSLPEAKEINFKLSPFNNGAVNFTFVQGDRSFELICKPLIKEDEEL
jgi:hypothetical protein